MNNIRNNRHLLLNDLAIKILNWHQIFLTILLITVFMVLAFEAYSQNKPASFNTVSPNSASLIEKGAATTSNLYNGSLSVNLPLTTFTSRNISIPIELSYNSNGIRLNQRPTSVGIGWNIILGGEITRIIRGYPDEKKATKRTDYRAGYYNNHGYFVPEITSIETTVDYDGSYLALRGLLNSYGGNTENFINDFVKPSYDQKVIDLAPDEFLFNFNGVSGSFYFSPDGGVKFKNKSGAQFKVEYVLTEGDGGGVVIPRAITSFKLTDNRGVQYFFGGVNAFEYSYPAQDVNPIAQTIDLSRVSVYSPGAAINTWKLVKVIDVDKNEVKLEYTRKEQIIDDSFFAIMGKIGANSSYASGYDVNLTRKAVTAVCQLDKIYDNLGNVLKFNYEVSNSLGSVATWGSPLYFRTNEVSLNMSMASVFQICSPMPDLTSGTPIGNLERPPQLYALKSIVKLYNDEQVEKTILNYRDETDKRLRLSTILNVDQMGVERSIFQFQYNPINLAGYTTKKDDFWGYYNANNFFEYSVEAKNYTYNKINADFINSKFPNTNYTRAELLEKIIFETKGYQKFEFEPNTCSAAFNYSNNQLVPLPNGTISGGLRLKKIKEFDENDVLLSEKIFHYVKNFATNDTISSGIQRWLTPDLSRYLSNHSDGLTWGFGLGAGFMKVGHDGNVVSYSEVTEENVGKGFKTFFFDNDENISIPAAPVIHGWSVPELNDYYTLKFGLLRKEQYYNESKVKVYEKTYDYSINDNEFLTSIVFSPPYSETVISGDVLKFLIYAFINNNYTNRIYLHTPLLIATTTKNFEQGNLTNEKHETYSYNQNKLLTESTRSNSTENYSVKTLYSYPDQFAASGSYWEWVTNSNGDMIHVPKFGTNAYSKMVTANMINYPIETITSLERLNQTSKIIKSSLTLFNDNNVSNLILPEKQLSFEPIDWQTSINLTTSQPHPTGIIYDNRYKSKIKYNKYDWRGNLLEAQKEFDKKNTYLYSYNGSYPVAEIINADYASVENALGGPMVIESFSNSNPNDLQTVSFFNLLRNSIATKNALISTQTYRPVVGVTSKIDPKGMATYYEYDGFGRLKNIRNDKENIVKSFKYSTGTNSVYVDIRPDWINTGLNTACETIEDTEYGNQLVNTGGITIEQKDNNINSPTYNQIRRIPDPNNDSVTCPASYYFTYSTDPNMASITIRAKRSYDDNTTKTMRFRVRHDSIQWGSQTIEQIVDIVISSQDQNMKEQWLFVNAASYLEVELLEVF